MHYRRIRLLIARQWEENKWAYCFGILAMAVILEALFFITWHWRDSFSGDVKHGIFLLGLLIGGTVYCGSLFRKLGNKSKAVWLICLPASAAEKILLVVLFGLVFYLLAYIAVFYVAEGFFMWLVNRGKNEVQHTSLTRNGFYNFLFIYCNLQLLILLGSIYFKRMAFIKTWLFCIAGFFLLTTLNGYILQWMTGEQHINSSLPFDYFQFVHNGENVYVYLSEKADRLTGIALHAVLPLLLCYCCYVRFKETEI